MKDKSNIERIIKYATKITRYMAGIKTFDDFASDDEKVDAVILNLEQIGETAKKLSDAGKELYPIIQWPSIIGLRNVISHDYEGIKLNIIYDIATKNIPDLLMMLQSNQNNVLSNKYKSLCVFSILDYILARPIWSRRDMTP